MCKMPKSLIKSTVQKVDYYLSLVDVDDLSKLDYQNAQTKIKREFDQQLSTFKEQIELEENKKVA